MNLGDAWNILGRDVSDVVAEIRRRPVEERSRAADEQLEAARGLAKKLMALHHPDRNPGDQEAAKRFRRVQDALDVVRAETESLKERLGQRTEGRAVFIEVQKR